MRPDDLWKASTGREKRSEPWHGRCVFASTIGAIELTKEVRLVIRMIPCVLGTVAAAFLMYQHTEGRTED